MLRITLLSLLSGAAVLVAVITQLFPPRHHSEQDAPEIVWDASAASVKRGISTHSGENLQVQLDSTGVALVSLNGLAIASKDFSFIHLALVQSADNMLAEIVWTSASDAAASHAYQLESRSRQSLWLSTDELRGWDGEITKLGLRFSGRAGETVLIRDFSVYPSSALRQVRAIYSDLTGYAPWNTAAMNTYTGAFNASSFYPVVLAVALLTCSLLAYTLLLFLLRTKLSFNPSVVALIFLTTWIILDLFWQSRLLQQLAGTHRIFAGKTSDEKLAAGPDAELFEFVAHTRPLLESQGSRIFVASSDKYSGMRAAYYLYPWNVYWSLFVPTLPPNRFLHKGDYVALIKPSPFRFDPEHNQITAPNRGKLKAELLFSDTSGTLVRLK